MQEDRTPESTSIGPDTRGASPRRGRGLAIALAVLLVAAVLAATGAAVFAADIRRIVLGPKAHYLYLEQRALQPLSGLVAAASRTSAEGASLSLNLPADRFNVADLDLPTDMGLRFDIVPRMEEKRSEARIVLATGGEDRVAFDVVVESDRVGIRFSGMDDAFYLFEYQESGATPAESPFDAEWAKPYLDLVMERFSAGIAAGNGQATEFMGVPCREYVLTLPAQKLRDLLKALLDLARNDEDLRDFVQSQIDRSAGLVPGGTESLAYGNLLDEVSKEIDAMPPVDLVQSIYYTRNETILGRRLVYGEVSLEMGSVEQDGTTGWFLEIGAEDGIVRLEGETEPRDKSGRMTMAVRLLVDDIQHLEITLEENLAGDNRTGELQADWTDVPDLPDGGFAVEYALSPLASDDLDLGSLESLPKKEIDQLDPMALTTWVLEGLGADPALADWLDTMMAGLSGLPGMEFLDPGFDPASLTDEQLVELFQGFEGFEEVESIQDILEIMQTLEGLEWVQSADDLRSLFEEG